MKCNATDLPIPTNKKFTQKPRYHFRDCKEKLKFPPLKNRQERNPFFRKTKWPPTVSEVL